jgi:hypothetical protein
MLLGYERYEIPQHLDLAKAFTLGLASGERQAIQAERNNQLILPRLGRFLIGQPVSNQTSYSFSIGL